MSNGLTQVIVFICPTCHTRTPQDRPFLRPCCIEAFTQPEALVELDVDRFHDDGGPAHPELD